jgi:hypothetical protein
MIIFHIGIRKITTFQANRRMLERWHKLPTVLQTLGGQDSQTRKAIGCPVVPDRW